MNSIKKIVGLSLGALITLCMATTGVWAYTQDTERSLNNRLTAGTLDLKTNDVNGVTQTLNSTSMKPGIPMGPSTIHLKNTGSLTGNNLDISFAYVESDGSPNPVNKTADETGAVIQVTTLSYNGATLLNSVPDSNGNGYKDLQDLNNASITGLTGLSSGVTRDFVITVVMRDGVSIAFTGDGINVTMTFTLRQ